MDDSSNPWGFDTSPAAPLAGGTDMPPPAPLPDTDAAWQPAEGPRTTARTGHTAHMPAVAAAADRGAPATAAAQPTNHTADGPTDGAPPAAVAEPMAEHHGRSWQARRAWDALTSKRNRVSPSLHVAIVLALVVLLLVTTSVNLASTKKCKAWNWSVLATAVALLAALTAVFVIGGFSPRAAQ